MSGSIPRNSHPIPIHRLWRWTPSILLAGLVIGCAADNHPAARTAPPLPLDSAADDSASSPSSSSSMNAMAEQARRDLEEWQRLQAKSAAPKRTADGHPAAPPTIIWNDAAGTPPRALDPGAEGPPTPVAFSEPDSATTPPVFARPTTTLPPAEPSPSLAATKATSSASPPPAAAASPSKTPDERVQALLVDLARELYQQAADADMPMRQLLLIAAAALVNPDRALHPDALPSLTARERELLASMQTFFVELGKDLAATGDPERIPAAVAKLRQALTPQPQLRLANATLCSTVEGFGKITPFEPRRFLAQSGQQVIVYVEVDKFTSELNPQGEYITELAQQLTIYSDRDGIPVWQEDWQTAVDRTRNQRSDFFIRQIITLPKPLSVGQYHLKLRVRDNKAKAANGESTRAEAEASIPFEMVADPKMTAGVPGAK